MGKIAGKKIRFRNNLKKRGGNVGFLTGFIKSLILIKLDLPSQHVDTTSEGRIKGLI